MSGTHRAGSARHRDAGPPRWQDPQLDETALEVARRVRLAVTSLRQDGHDRWATFLEPLLPAFEDGDRADLLAAARRARAAFGARDSVLDVAPEPEMLGLRDAVDRLQLQLERRRAAGT